MNVQGELTTTRDVARQGDYMKKTIGALAVGILALTANVGVATAESQLPPGISTGIPTGAPLPEGIYNITWFSLGNRPGGADVAYGVPRFLWSTPFQIFGGRVIIDGLVPYASVAPPGAPTRIHDWANPFLNSQIKWDLGGGLFGGFESGVYFPTKSDVGNDFASWQGGAMLSYLGNNWNLTAAAFYGTGKSGFAPDWANIDLTATKKFDKFEIGAIAYGSTDLTSPTAGYLKQSQFAVGGLVGYDFGPVNAQFKLAHDIAQQNRGGYETRGTLQLIVPLWSPKPAAGPQGKPVVAKF